MSEGEFDFLRSLKEARDSVLPILQTSNVLYQFQFHESVFGPKNSLEVNEYQKYFQRKSDNFIDDVSLTSKIGMKLKRYSN
jgi:hypothetical protein